MKIVEARGLRIGEGRPKIAVSISGSSDEEIKSQIKELDLEKIDLLEWRADFYRDIGDMDKLLKVLREIRQYLGDTPIIFTFRSKDQGGEGEIFIGDYIYLNTRVAESNLVDIIDIEVFKEKEKMKDLIKTIGARGVLTIASYHDFLETPKEDRLREILKDLKSQGDILKLALMAKNPEDVFSLIGLVKEVEEDIGKPMIVISMGELGKISRVGAKSFASSISFAALDNSSTGPGQIELDKLYDLLEYNSK